MNGSLRGSKGRLALNRASRKVLKRSKWSSWMVIPMTVLVFSVFSVLPAAATLAGSTFNATDGTLDSGASGLITRSDTPSGSLDNSFGAGVHEDTVDPPTETGGVPDKADLLKFFMATEKGAGGDDFLYLAWERRPDQGGATDMDFEFNQSDLLAPNGITPIRTIGDLLITYAITNGGSQVEIAYRVWGGSSWGGENLLTGFAEGSFNTDPVTGDHYFGEAAINLIDSGLFPTGKCVNFGSAYLKSRSSHSFESKMKDFIGPEPIFISNCGKVVVTKDAVPNDATDFSFTTTGTGLSAFSLDDDSNAILPNSRPFVDLLPGAYSVTEAAAAGWDLTSATCTASVAGASGTRSGNAVNIQVVAGGVVDCTFVNTAQLAQLNVTKHVVNDNGGEAVAGDFAIQVSGSGVSSPSFQGQEAPGTAVTLTAGAYEVSETPVGGYAATYSPDCSGTIGRGETRNCTVTNNDQPPGLTVIKHVVNDNGGINTAADFQVNITGTLLTPASFPGDEDGTAVSINPGAYSVAEGAHPGYDVTYSSDCSGSISLGQSKVCTVTNDDIPPKLTVVKTVINDNGGSKTAANFNMHVTAAGDDPDVFPGSETGTEPAVLAGAYSVIEGSHAGYTVTYSDDCDGSIGVGETRTCTVTNNDIQPKLIIKKEVVNDDGGTGEPGDFTLNVNASSPSPVSVSGNEEGVDVMVNSGSYSLSETPVAGYAASYSDNCDGTIAVGQVRTCTVTNNDVAPGLTVIKHVINDNGGDMEAEGFEITVTGVSAEPASFDGDEEGTKVSLKAGAYSVAEAEVSGYAAAYSADCTGSIDIGETKVCTVTNDDIQPRLIVIKTVDNDDGGTLAADDFILNVEGETPVPASFAGSNEGTEIALDAGSYSVTEVEVDGYAGTFTDGCSGELAVGETATCTVTNLDLSAGLTVIKRVVNDDGGAREAGDFRITVESAGADPEEFDGSEAGTVLDIGAGPYGVTELQLAGYLGTLSAGCSGVIALDESAVCIITNNDVPAEVAGVVMENNPPPAEFVEVLGISLPQTGLNIALGLMVAFALIGGGFGFLWWNRRTQDAKG